MGDVMDDDEVMQTPALLLNAVDEAATCLPDGYAAVQPTPLEWPALIAQMRDGRVNALRQFYESSASYVYSIALRITRDPSSAEEVTAATFLQAWLQAAKFNASRGSAKSWLQCIVRSRAIDALRNTAGSQAHPDPLSVLDYDRDYSADPQNMALEAERSLELHRALAKLGALQRQLLALAFFKGLTHEEIAMQVKLPLGTVKSHIRRAIATLRGARTKVDELHVFQNALHPEM